MFPEAFQAHIAPVVNNFIDGLIETYAPFFDSIAGGILSVLITINDFLVIVPERPTKRAF